MKGDGFSHSVLMVSRVCVCERERDRQTDRMTDQTEKTKQTLHFQDIEHRCFNKLKGTSQHSEIAM